METQSDLEVILEFLEEYYRQHAGGNMDKMCWTAVEPGGDRGAPVDGGSCEQCWTCREPAGALDPHTGHPGATCSQMSANNPASKAAFPSPKTFKPAPQPLLADAPLARSQKTSTALRERGPLPNFASTRRPTKHTAGSGGKLRLFHFLFEVLEDPDMAHCVRWVPEASGGGGVFRFSSSNKEQVAALWGQRKGNKRPMTYQKMSRALRNYGRSGEIFKVKKKLTYRFSRETLTLLHGCQRGGL